MMECPIADHLKLHMQRQQLGARELARRAEVKPSFIYDILNGRSGNPSTLKLARIAGALGIPLSALVSDGSITAAPGLQVMHHAAFDGLRTPPPLDDTQRATCPVAFSQRWLSKQLGGNPDHLRWCLMPDDTMQPTLKPQDMLLIDISQHHINPDGLYLIAEADRTNLRRVEMLPGKDCSHVRIVADNPCYSSYERPLQMVQVLGRLLWFSRQTAHSPWPQVVAPQHAARA